MLDVYIIYVTMLVWDTEMCGCISGSSFFCLPSLSTCLYLLLFFCFISPLVKVDKGLTNEKRERSKARKTEPTHCHIQIYIYCIYIMYINCFFQRYSFLFFYFLLFLPFLCVCHLFFFKRVMHYTRGEKYACAVDSFSRRNSITPMEKIQRRFVEKGSVSVVYRVSVFNRKNWNLKNDFVLVKEKVRD